MHSLLVIGSLLVVGSSAQYFVDPRVVITAPSVAISSQYHAQDELGQFAFGHRSDTQSREEVKGIDGSVRGAYSYIDPVGKLVHVQYLADHNGFRILGANNLPVAPEVNLEVVKDTPEVVAARAEFTRKFEEAKSGKLPEIISRSRRDLIHSSIIPTVLAKTTLKTSEFVPVDAKVPASTKLAEIKEKEKEIITPYTLGVSSFLHTPILTSSLVSPNVLVKTTEFKPIEKKEVLPLVTSRLITPSVLSYSSLPLITKTTIKTNELKTLEDVKTPAATRLAEIKEVEKHLITPLSWSSPSLVHSPLVWW